MSSTRYSDLPQTDDAVSEYARELAKFFPAQGEWSEEAYLDLTDHSNKRVELCDGQLEFLPPCVEVHQALIAFLFFGLYPFVEARDLGQVYCSGIRVRLRKGNIRMPDVIFLHKDHFNLRHNRVWDGADLVMEIVSDAPKDRKRDYVEKLAEYAAANIAEYWIVDPELRTLIIHRLDNGQYQVQGQYRSGDEAASAYLPGFTIDVAKLFAVIDQIPE